MQKIAKAARAAALTLLTLALGGALAGHAAATDLITNGGFETGTLSGWSVGTQGQSAFYARSTGTQNNIFRSTVGPASGSFYAVSDQTPATTMGGQPLSSVAALFQSFTVPGPAASVLLSFDMFVDNYADPNVYTAGPAATLDPNMPDNQAARVDLLTAGAGIFSTASGDVLQTFYNGSDPVTDPLLDNPHTYTHYTDNLTALVGAGGTYQIRFAEVNNEDNLYQGVDNVHIQFTPAASAVPEPGPLALLLLGLLPAGCMVARRRNA